MSRLAPSCLNSLSIPSAILWPVRNYPHLWISTRGHGSSGTSTHLKRALPGAHYRPIRHLPRPASPLAGPPLPIGCPPVGSATDFPLLHFGFLHTCCRHYPGGTAGCASRSLPRQQRPSPLSWRVGSHDDVSRPARRSLALRPVRFAALQKRTLPRMLQTIRHLPIRPRCFRSERE